MNEYAFFFFSVNFFKSNSVFFVFAPLLYEIDFGAPTAAQTRSSGNASKAVPA
jgi:hypothetical protein